MKKHVLQTEYSTNALDKLKSYLGTEYLTQDDVLWYLIDKVEKQELDIKQLTNEVEVLKVNNI